MTTIGSTSARGRSSSSGRAETGSRARGRLGDARRWLGTTPARVWLLTSVCVVAVAGLFGSASLTLNQAREGLHVLGHEAGRQAMATTDLYFALADMDARMADVLLMGSEHDLGSGRQDALQRYEDSREQANEALLQAALLIEDDAEDEVEDGTEDEVEERNIRAVLDGMGSYERLAAEAQLANDEAQAPPGRVDEAALETYRRATRLMHTELMPKAFNLGLDSSAIVRENHEEGRSSVGTGRAWVMTAGGAAVVVLVLLQFYLRARFRRRFNVPLLAATVGAAVLTGGVALALDDSGEYQGEAKEGGLDAAMALSRAGAIATDMQADQSRYLLDPQRADNYQQVYLERAQQVLYRPADNLADYYEAVDEATLAYSELSGSEEPDLNTLGYLGKRAYDALLPGQEDALAEVLGAYGALQHQDRELRSAAEEGDLDRAVEVRMGVAHSEDGVFRSYEQALAELTQLHEDAFDEGIERGEARLDPWTWLLPSGTVVLLVLVVLGVRPRLSEYR